MTKFTYNDIVKAKLTADQHLRPSERARKISQKIREKIRKIRVRVRIYGE